MSRESLVLLLGVIIFFTPALVIPETWKVYVTSGAGVLLVIVGYMLRRSAYLRRIERDGGVRETDSFVESAHTHQGAVDTHEV